MDQRFDAMEQRFDAIDERFDKIDRRLESVEQRLDVLELRFEAMEQRFDRMEQRFEKMEKAFEKMEKAFEKTQLSMNILSGHIMFIETTAFTLFRVQIPSEQSRKQMVDVLERQTRVIDIGDDMRKGVLDSFARFKKIFN